MARIAIVEVRQPMKDATINSRVHSDMLFVAPNMDIGRQYIRENPNEGGDLEVWCWKLYEVEVGDPRAIIHNEEIYDILGQPQRDQLAAWDVCRARRKA